MLTSSVTPGTNLVTITYDRSVGTDDMLAVRADLDKVLAEFGSLRLLVEYGTIDLGRIEVRALWEDMKMIGLLRRIEAAALVADQGWLRRVTELADRVLPGRLEVFPVAEREAARAWLSSASVDDAGGSTGPSV